MSDQELKLRLLSLGLKKSRSARILEEFSSDFPLDPSAKRTAITRILKSYLSVSNLVSPLLVILGAVGLVLTLKSHWLWAACLLLITLFITYSTSEVTLSFKAFKIYKVFVGVLVLVTCYVSITSDNSGNWGRMNNLDFWLGNNVYIVGGAIALVALTTITVDFFKTKDKVIQLQRILFVICTASIYLNSNDTRPWQYSQAHIIQLSLTACLFLAVFIKRKPVLAN